MRIREGIVDDVYDLIQSELPYVENIMAAAVRRRSKSDKRAYEILVGMLSR